LTVLTMHATLSSSLPSAGDGPTEGRSKVPYTGFTWNLTAAERETIGALLEAYVVQPEGPKFRYQVDVALANFLLAKIDLIREVATDGAQPPLGFPDA